MDRMARFFGLTEAQDTARLMEEKRRFEALLGSFPAEFCGWDMEGVQAISPHFADLLSTDQIETVEDVSHCLAPEFGREFLELYDRLKSGGVPFQMSAPLHDHTARVEISGRVGAGLDGVTQFHMLWARMVDEEPELMRPRFVDQSSRNLALEALDRLSFPVWLRGPDGSLDWVNKAHADALGQPAARVVALGDELAGEEGKALARDMHNSLDVEARDTHAVMHGERKAVTLVEHPAALPADPTIGVALDRTEAATVGAELRRRTEAQRHLLDQLNAAITLYGPDQRLEFYNRAFTRLFGLEDAWLDDGPSYMEVLEALRERRMVPETGNFPEYRAAELSMFKSLTEPDEELVNLPDGRNLRRVVSPHALGGLMVAFEDVTSSIQLEMKFKEAMAVQRETLDNLGEGIAVIGTDGRLKLFNPAFEEIWDITRPTLEAGPHIRLLAERMGEQFGAAEDAAHARGLMISASLDRRHVEEHLRFSGGRCLDFTSRPLPDGAVMLNFVDVTDTVQMEDALRQRAQTLEAADRQSTEFLAVVSRKLRDPLNVVLGYSEALNRGLFGEMSSVQSERIYDLHSAASELNKLVHNVLDLASFNAGKLGLDCKDIELSALLDDVASMSLERATNDHLRILVQCEEEVGSVSVDYKRITQAIMQLVSNAIDYTEPGGTITLRAGRELARGRIWLSVHDDGVGIPEAEQRHLLGHYPSTPMGLPDEGDLSGSLGIGMALVRRIMKMHGGSIKLRSNAEDGTCVTLYLPQGEAMREAG
ncbi:MAG: cell cycle protein kinase DivL [Alphaproteobacteria bacterium]